VLSLVSWAVCPVIPAVIALVLANSAERAIREGAPMVEGRGLVTATRWISWINIGVWGATLAFFLIIILFSAISNA
jgi:TctA family transporter